MKTGISHIVLSIIMMTSCWVKAGEVRVAVASNFTAPMKSIATQFEQQSGHNVVLSFGSSGKFFAQIQHGAPFDVFLSADQHKPNALASAGAIVPGSQFTYAIGQLVLWSADKSRITKGSAALTQTDYHKLALANPRLAPYGAAAIQTLKALSLKDNTREHWVQGENIAQTYHFVASGNAQLGFVALSQVTENGKIKSGSGWVVPSKLYAPIKQDAVQLQHAKSNAAAHALIAFLKSPEAHKIITSYGYKLE